MKNRREILLSGATLAAGLALAGCDSGQTPKKDAPPTAPATPTATRLTAQEIQAVIAAKRNYRIGVLFPFQGIPFWTNEAYGIFDQATKSGVTLLWRSADGYANVSRQVEHLSEMKALKVDAVLLGATNPAGTRAAVEDLVASGVPVVNHVTSTDSAKVSAKVLVDYVDIGKQQARFMKSAGASGDVLMLNGPAGAEWSGNEVKGFKAELANYAALKIVAERNSDPERISGQRFIEDLLVRFPNTAAIFSVTDSLAMGAVDALTAAGKAGKVLVTTAGFSEETVEPIRLGKISLNVDESPVLIGRAALNAVVQVLNGGKAPPLQFVPTPEHTAKSLTGMELTGQWAPSNWRLP